MNTQAFALVDCLMAIIIVVLTAAGVLAMALQSRKLLFMDQERQVAWSILNNAMINPISDKPNFEQGYTFQGLPCSGSGHFRLESELTEDWLFLTVSWINPNGEEQFIAFERMVSQ